MIRLGEVLAGLHGAWLLARRRPEGLRYMDTSREGALRSFWAAVVALPATLPLVAMRLSHFPPRADALDVALVEVVAYVVGWTAFPVLAHFAARIAEREDRYPALVVACNWTSLAQVVVLLVAAPVTLSDILPPAIDALVELGVRIALVAWLASAIRAALDVSWPAAIGLAVVEFVLGLSIFRTVVSLEDAWPLPPGAA
ncbi:MAG: YIP1 family protein [Alphaproteobacteria bacterium]